MFRLSTIAKSKMIGSAVLGLMLGVLSATGHAAVSNTKATAKATTAKATTTTVSKPLVGRIDGAPLANARYVTLSRNGKISLSGFTTRNGSFNYRNGETVQFYVGDILLGSTAAKSLVTPVSLVQNAKNPDALSNLLRFLQTVDSDISPANGIQISNHVHKSAKNLKVDFDKAMRSFQVQSSLVKLMGIATNSPTLPDAVKALTDFRMSLLNAYDTNSDKTVLNLMNTKWKATLTSSDCPTTTASQIHTFNLFGHFTSGYNNLTVNNKGVCKPSGLSLLMSLYENDGLFSCAKGCTMADLNGTVDVAGPIPHKASLVYQPNSNIITIIHHYANGRNVIETLKKQ